MTRPPLTLTLSTPCTRRWEDLAVLDAQTRWCSACDTAVHDLSALSPEEAEAFLASGVGRCVRFRRRRQDGTVVLRAAGAALALAALTASPLALSSPHGKAAHPARDVWVAPLELPKPPAPKTLVLSVEDAGGLPLPGARVLLREPGLGAVLREVQTSAQGQVTLEGLSPGRYSLEFHASWGEVFVLRAVDLETEKGLALQVTLALPLEEIVVGGI